MGHRSGNACEHYSPACGLTRVATESPLQDHAHPAQLGGPMHGFYQITQEFRMFNGKRGQLMQSLYPVLCDEGAHILIHAGPVG
eukprot:3504268-Karenia_brevis.AAC.1